MSEREREREKGRGEVLLNVRLGAFVPFTVLRDGLFGVFRRRFLRRYFCFLRRCELAGLESASRLVLVLALTFPAAFLVFSAPTFLGMMLEVLWICSYVVGLVKKSPREGKLVFRPPRF